MVKDDNNVDSTEDIDSLPNIGGIQLKYGEGDPVTYEEIERIKPMSNDVAQKKHGSVFKTIGIVTILYGIFAGVRALLISFEVSPPSSIVVGLGIALLYIVPGVICIGIYRIINLLAK